MLGDQRRCRSPHCANVLLRPSMPLLSAIRRPSISRCSVAIHSHHCWALMSNGAILHAVPALSFSPCRRSPSCCAGAPFVRRHRYSLLFAGALLRNVPAVFSHRWGYLGHCANKYSGESVAPVTAPIIRGEERRHSAKESTSDD